MRWKTNKYNEIGMPINQPKTAPLTQKTASRQHTVIQLGQHLLGHGHFCTIAGPCSVESPEQIMAIAQAVGTNGAKILRGGAFKPRTSPYDFQGHGEQAFDWLRQAASSQGMACVSEVMDASQLKIAAQYLDIIQIGSRNMQNFNLLKSAGTINKPILLKRGFAATYQEFLMAAEYILQAGNPNVILCERGIRTFETATRNTLDLAAVPYLQQHTHLPIITDPSHGTGLRELVPPMALASQAAGAHGVMVEVHTNPEQSISDARQTISTDTFAAMMKSIKQSS
jgi:3-deoxy-7-phosphoheptulonate synthase